MGDGFVEISRVERFLGGFLEVSPRYYNNKVGRNADSARNLRENDPRTTATGTAQTRTETGGAVANQL